jgi:hypothetical protein
MLENFFTMAIYRHSMAILLFCVIKLYYLGNYHGMAVNYTGKKFYNIGLWWQTLISLSSGNTKGGSITLPLTSCLTGMD